MSNACLPCNVIFMPCRKAVSQNKRRYQKDGFDLDLTILSDKIIVHGFPSEGIEHIYRNPKNEVRRFLDTYHRGHYLVFNFCSESGRAYDPSLFHGRVQHYPFKDHHCPPLDSMVTFANNAKIWLEGHEKNICSLHCKAGKGRAGVMSSILLLRTGVCASAAAALDKFDSLRTIDKKGVTLTSQRKFVYFYEYLWRKYWNIQGNIGDVPGDHDNKFIIPNQPEYCLLNIQIINVSLGTVVNELKATVYKSTNSDPILLQDCNVCSSMLEWSCNKCLIQGNFIISITERKNLGYVPLLAVTHNTLFLNRSVDGYTNFNWQELDIGYEAIRRFGQGVTLRLLTRLVVGIDFPLAVVIPSKNSIEMIRSPTL